MTRIKDQLKEGLEVAASGELSLDKAKARAKLRMFRLPDPHFYVLQFVRAASVLNAETISFEFGVGGMTCTFDAPLPDWAFNNFWDAGFRARRTREDVALHNLALGIGAAQVLTPGSITVSSGGQRIVFKDDEEEVSRISPIAGTQIKMRERFRVGHVFDFFTDHAELIALREYCLFAHINVEVQGEPLLPPLGYLRTPLANERGFLQLTEENTGQVEFHVLRDDVRVDRIIVNSQGLPALGWLNSQTLATDLSGLKLADPDAAMPGVYAALYDAYHHALLQWVARGPTDQHSSQTIGRALTRHLGSLHQLGVEMPPHTRELFEWWAALPLFHSALGEQGEAEPFLMFIDGNHFRFATKRFPEFDRTKHGAVMHISADLRGLDQAMAEAGFELNDATKEFEDEATRRRNRELHSRTPVVEDIAPMELKRRVEQGAYEVVLGVPDDGHLGQRAAGFLHAYNMLVRRVPTKLPLIVAVNGPLAINFLDLDLERTEKLDELATAAVEQSAALLDMVGRKLRSKPSQHLREVLAALLHAALNDRYEIAILQMMGFEGEPLTRLMLPVRVWDGMPTAALFTRLGAAADAPLFVLYPKGYASLREILEWEEPPIVATMDLQELSTLKNNKARVLVLSARDAEMIEGLRDVRHAYDAVVEMSRRKAFFDKPPFDTTPLDYALRAAAETTHHDAGSFTTTVELIGVGSAADLLILAHDRLVTMKSVPSEVGQVRAIVHSEAWTLNADLTGVEEDELYFAVIEKVDTIARELATQLILDACSGVDLPAQREYIWWRAREGASMSLLPAYVHKAGEWQPVGLTLHEARQRVAANGRLVHVTSRMSFDFKHALSNATVFRVPHSPVDYTVMFPGGRLVHLDEQVQDIRTLPTFQERPLFESPLSRKMPRWTLSVDGFQFEGSVDRVDQRHRHRVHVVWDNRELETITLPSKFGAFVTIVTGPAVRPDASMRYLGEGRAEMLAAVRTGPERLVRELCRRLSKRPTAQGELEHARRWLLTYLAAEHRADFPSELYPTLRATPLFPAQGERLLSHDEVQKVAIEGVVSWSHRPDPRAALHFPKTEIRTYEGAVAASVVLMPIEQMEFALDRGPAPPLYNSDQILNDIATTLIEARGERRDLFDDRLALSLRWHPNAKSPCRVNSNGVILSKVHPLVRRAIEAGPGSIAMQFLSSVVYSAVNAYYREIADNDELELQANLLTRGRRMLESS